MTDRIVSTPQQERLAKPFPREFVQKKEREDYVNHGVVQQRLIGTIGPPDQHVVEVIRGDYDPVTTGKGTKKERVWPGRKDAVVGVILAVDYHIDGRVVHIEDVGTPEGYYMAPHDGERLKKAISDAVKRCAKQVGVALDLWSKGAYFLPALLEKNRRALAQVVDPDDPDGPTRMVDAESGEVLEVEQSVAGSYNPDAPDPDDATDDNHSAPTDATVAAPADPGPDAAPWDDQQRRGADAERRNAVRAAIAASEQLLRADPDYTVAQHTATVTYLNDATTALDKITDYRDRMKARLADLNGTRDVVLLKRDYAKLTELGVDDEARHSLVHLATGGRTASSKPPMTKPEYDRLMALAQGWSADAFTIGLDDGDPVLVVAGENITVDRYMASVAAADGPPPPDDGTLL